MRARLGGRGWVRRAGVALRRSPAKLLIEQLIKIAKNRFKVLRCDRRFCVLSGWVTRA
jgi:hypothetical protein